MTNWQELRQKIFDAFAPVPRPDFSSIQVLGCCEEHESDFAWYRYHDWREFEEALATRGFDPGDFPAIHPLAFHYFTPGILGAEIIRLGTSTEPWAMDEGWIGHYLVDQRQGFKENYLPYFDQPQRQVVAEALAWYKTWFLLRHGYDYDEPSIDLDCSPSIANSIQTVWRSAR